MKHLLTALILAMTLIAVPAYATGGEGGPGSEANDGSDTGNGGDEGNDGEANDGDEGQDDAKEAPSPQNSPNGGDCYRNCLNEKTPDNDAVLRLYRWLRDHSE